MASQKIMLLILLTFVSAALTEEECPADYSPCVCNTESEGELRIECGPDVPMKEIRNIFTRSPFNPYTFEITPSSDDLKFIPENILNDKNASEIRITCPTPDYKLNIHPNAFLASKKSESGVFVINGCDLSELDFSFLEGFNNLFVLQLIASTNLHLSKFSQLPNLDSLEVLDIDSCTGLNDETMELPHLVKGLTALALTANGLNDESVSRILDHYLNASRDTLEILSINKNALTKVPEQVKFFNALGELYFGNNEVPLNITSGSLSFSSPVSYVDLASSQVIDIQHGAFGGNFSMASVDLKSNTNLTRFEESVFKVILDNIMENTENSGMINLAGCRFDCETDLCHLAWLVRVSPNGRNYRDGIVSGKCLNELSFDELTPEMFYDCPIPL